MEYFSNILNLVNQSLGGPLGSMVGAVLFLIIGWVVSALIGGFVRKLLNKAKVNERMNSSTGKSLDLVSICSKIVFWFIFLMVISGALNMLNINAVSEPFSKMTGQILAFFPKLIGAAIIGVVGWIVATVIRTLIGAVLAKTSIDEKLSEDAGVEPMSGTLSDIIYWVILLFVITLVLEKLELNSLFQPLTNMIDKIMSFLPNIFLAGIIFFVGYVIAKVMRGIVTGLVSTMNLQALTTKAGISKDSENSLPNLAGSLVFLVIIIPVAITALDALKIEVISRPATNMLNKIMEALPNVVTAVAILAVTYFVMRMVTNVIKGVLENTQLNALPEKIGMQAALGEAKVSDIIASLIMLFAMLFAIIMSANLLGFKEIGDIVTMFIGFAGNILLGAIILVIGFWLANLVSGIIERSEQGSKFLATIVRVLIMGLVLAMGLKAMDIADSIVNLAFGLTLGSVAVAFALAFGLGGREAAARCLKNIQDKCDVEK